MKILKSEWLQLLILAVPFCVVALLWDKIPERIPVHWNGRGQVDGWGSKHSPALFLVPSINCFFAVLLFLTLRIDPRLRKLEGDASASVPRTLKVIRLGVTALFGGIAVWLILAAASGVSSPAAMPQVLQVGVGAVILVLGNLMGKIRPNYLIGIRTPWTLESKEVWTKTHRFGGRLMVVVGLLMILLCFVVPPKAYNTWVFLPSMIVLVVATTAHSYLTYRQLNRSAAR